MRRIRIVARPAPLFERLPRGPSGLAREAVASNQRARIYGGMIESVSRHGYGGTTVAEVIALAGVSRRAFYEHFANREDCFLATHDIVTARARRLATCAWAGERGFSGRLHAASAALLADAARAPKGPRLALVQALGVGPRARARMLLAERSFERSLAAALAAGPPGASHSLLAPWALVGGLGHLMSLRLGAGRERELPAICGPALEWFDCYRANAVASLLSPRAPQALARSGRRGPAVGLPAGRDRRSLALCAVSELALKEGYASLSESRIASMAGISRGDLRRQFASAEACFLAAVAEALRRARSSVRRRMAPAGDWPQAALLGLGALLDELSGPAPPLRLAFVEIYAAGEPAIERAPGVPEGLLAELIADAPRPRHGRAVVREALTGALWSILSGRLASEVRLPRPALEEQLGFLVLAPYLGPAAAVREILSARSGALAA